MGVSERRNETKGLCCFSIRNCSKETLLLCLLRFISAFRKQLLALHDIFSCGSAFTADVESLWKWTATINNYLQEYIKKEMSVKRLFKQSYLKRNLNTSFVKRYQHLVLVTYYIVHKVTAEAVQWIRVCSRHHIADTAVWFRGGSCENCGGPSIGETGQYH
jgi:hypothetical protein